MDKIFNNINQYIIIVSKSGYIKFCNNSFLSRTGYTLRELTENDEGNKIISIILKGLPKAEFEILSKYNEKMKFYGSILDINYTEDGYIFIGDSDNTKIERCINRKYESDLKNHTCIQDGKRKEIEQELEVVLSTTTELIAIIDKRGNFKKIGEGWYKTFGWTAEEAKNIKWQDLFHPKERKSVLLSIIKGRRENEIIKGTNLYRCKNESYKIVHWQCRYIKEREIYIGSAIDITELTEVKNEAKRFEKALMMEGLKNKFFANLSHEFKTPLNVIFSAVQLIEYNLNEKSIDDEEMRFKFDKYVSAIRKNSYRLLRLVNNLIDISKMDVGNYKINLSNNDIVHLLDEIICSVNMYTRGKNIEIIFDPQVEELELAYDSKEIERVILNIISNAIKSSKDGSKIYIKLSVKSDKVIISVKDNGIGIKQEELDNIFKKFNKIENIILEKTEGSGIGLAISKEIIRMHGGEIWAESQYGEGSTFYFSLPIRRCSVFEENEYYQSSHIEGCKIEFSDIYEFNDC